MDSVPNEARQLRRLACLDTRRIPRDSLKEEESACPFSLPDIA